jgi:hypothetical protein
MNVCLRTDVVVSNIAPTNKFICACLGFRVVYLVGTRFILVRTEHPYIQSSVPDVYHAWC